jgi:sugar phosphate isomerase/epimerase
MSPYSLEGKVPNLKNRFQFRLGTTSYIVPADIAPNVSTVAPYVDDIEIVLFESETHSNLPDDATMDVLRHHRNECHVSYTIHLPLDIQLGSADRNERARSVEQCRRIIQLMEPLNPFAYVLHLPIGEMAARSVSDPERWQRHVADGVTQMLETGIFPRRICVETLAYPFELAAPVVERLDLSVCIDVGHILMNGYSLPAYIHQWFDRTRIVHLHGIADGKDHQSIVHLPDDVLNTVIQSMNKSDARERVLTLEIFGEADFCSSMNRMKGFVQCVE